MLASVDIPAAVDTSLYPVPAATKLTGTVHLVNHSAGDVSVSVHVVPGGMANKNDAHWLLPTTLIPAGQYLTIAGFVCEPTDEIMAYADAVGVNGLVWGETRAV